MFRFFGNAEHIPAVPSWPVRYYREIGMSIPDSLVPTN
jgi:hypothetical protein